LFLVMSLFATVIPSMQASFTWFIILALGVQLFDFVSSPDRSVDFVVLLLITLAVLPLLNILTIIAQYITWILLFALIAQLYDDYAS